MFILLLSFKFTYTGWFSPATSPVYEIADGKRHLRERAVIAVQRRHYQNPDSNSDWLPCKSFAHISISVAIDVTTYILHIWQVTSWRQVLSSVSLPMWLTERKRRLNFRLDSPMCYVSKSSFLLWIFVGKGNSVECRVHDWCGLGSWDHAQQENQKRTACAVQLYLR